MVGVTLIIAALALFLNVGQISQAAYDKGIGTGAAQAKKADYTQAYDKGVADGYEKAKQEWQLSQ
jgi:flagellar biosynthesis/type III secretory pathway protein FliH